MKVPRHDRQAFGNAAWLAALLPVGLAVGLSLTGASARAGDAGASQRLRLEILGRFPHDETSFTQGLLWHDGALYESTGQYGESKLRRLDLESGEVEAEHRLAPELFGEGLALVGDRLVQLTYRKGEALIYDLASFEPRGTWRYEGEGWGLCFDGRALFMSDGTSWIARRDPESFAVAERLPVSLEGRPVNAVNELECAEGWLYANVWQTDWILRIDPVTGAVAALIDASPLRRSLGLPPGGEAVLNGIAYRPETATFLLTGKNWPQVFEVIFVE